MEFNSKDFLNVFGKNLASEKSQLNEEEFHKFLSLSPKRILNPFQAGPSTEFQNNMKTIYKYLLIIASIMYI